MKDKLLFGTIGVLVGIVVMQWTMPSGQATVVTPPVGVIVAAAGDAVLAVDGSIWFFWNHDHWQQAAQLPFPVSDARMLAWESGSAFLVIDKYGDQWEHLLGGQWENHGQPPIAPLPTEESTWGKVKATFTGKGDKP